MSNWLQHTIERTGLRPQNQALALVILGVLLALIFGGVYLSQVAGYATSNREIEALIAERDRLEFTNEQLRAEIANLQTVPRLLVRAEALGFRPAGANDLRYLTVAGYNPNRDSTVIELDDRTQLQPMIPTYAETFSGWLQRQLDTLLQQFDQFNQE